MDVRQKDLNEAWQAIESAESQRNAVDRTRKAQEKESLEIQRVAKQQDVNRINSHLAAFGEAADQPPDKSENPVLGEILRTLRAIYQTEAQNTKLLRQLIDIVS